MEKKQSWLEIQRDYLERQAPLRDAWNDASLSDSEREAARVALHALVAEISGKCPPIIGTFVYTEEDEEEARKAGF